MPHVHVVWEGGGKWLVRKERLCGHFSDSHLQGKMQLATNTQFVQFYRYGNHALYQFSLFLLLCSFCFKIFLFFKNFIYSILISLVPPNLLSVSVIKHRLKPDWGGVGVISAPSLQSTTEEAKAGA